MSIILLILCVFVDAFATTDKRFEQFAQAVDAYQVYKEAQDAYFIAIETHKETKLAWDIYRASNRDDKKAHKKAEAAWLNARDSNKEVKTAYTLFNITAYSYDRALHAIEEVKWAFTLWEEAQEALDKANRVIDEAHDEGRQAGPKAWRTVNKALTALDEADDYYFTILSFYKEAIEKAYKERVEN